MEIGLQVPASGIAHTLAEAEAVAAELGLPVIVRAGQVEMLAQHVEQRRARIERQRVTGAVHGEIDGNGG